MNLIASSQIETERKSPKLYRVVIVQRRMTHYRLPLFDRMRELLEQKGIDLIVVQGDATADEKLKKDCGNLSWGAYVPCSYFLGGRICWQYPKQQIAGADMVIVTQENKLIFNLLLRLPGNRVKMAYWGHGRNFQAEEKNHFSERIKSWLLRQTDWWFAYTSVSAQVVQQAGFPAQKITVLNNAIDTESLRSELLAVTAAEVEAMRGALGLDDQPVGLLIASLHKDKRIDFLLESAALIRTHLPDFQLLIVGDGLDRELVKKAIAEGASWIHWLGVRKGPEKAVLLSLAQVILNPGMVGLSILDSFVAGLPMITTACGTHSPEIAYLESGINGLITENSISAYTHAVVNFFQDPQLQVKLRAGCEASAMEYSINNMAERFCQGICLALGVNSDLQAEND